LFADEVTKLHDHLRAKGVRMWIWGDRFLDGEATGIGKWEASLNETAGAVDLIPRDIVICGEGPEPPESARESARCFKDLFRAIREGD
jgi:hypothetical protein